jgi:hypothetical protein
MVLASLMVALGVLAGSAPAIAPPLGPLDSLALLDGARRAQTEFERVRARHAPWGSWAGSGPCDERVGRFCLTHASERDDETRPPYRPPPEPEAVRNARARLDSILSAVVRVHPGDAWVVGQRVAYRGEAGDWAGALAAAQACASPEPGWCALLVGFALHGGGRVAASEAAFRRGLEALPPREQATWWNPDPLVEPEVARHVRRLGAAAHEHFLNALWAVSDPLYLEGGNALLTEHFSRHVLARIRAEARNPHGMRWGDDLTEILLRFGPEVGWERVRDAGLQPGSAGISARFAWDARGIVPALDALLDPVTAGSESFAAARSRTRSRHATPRVPRLRDLSARFTRFQRGDSLLVVAAWEAPDLPLWDSVPALRFSEAALFFQPIELHPDTGLPRGVGQRSRVDLPPDADGVGQLLAGPYGGILSLELLDERGGRGWRARTGTGPGLEGLSDILLLRPVAPRAPMAGGDCLPTGAADSEDDRTSLDAVWLSALASSEVSSDAVGMAWEVYDLPAQATPIEFRVFLAPSEGSWLRRAGEALRIVAPRSAMRLAWTEFVHPEETAGDGVLFRKVLLDLSGLHPGRWGLTLEVETPDGRVRTRETDLRVAAPGLQTVR